jgi:hypothetical protein
MWESRLLLLQQQCAGMMVSIFKVANDEIPSPRFAGSQFLSTHFDMPQSEGASGLRNGGSGDSPE